jgi:hypothetical protein
VVLQGIEVDPQTLGDALGKVVHHHVCFANQLIKQGFPALVTSMVLPPLWKIKRPSRHPCLKGLDCFYRFRNETNRSP